MFGKMALEKNLSSLFGPNGATKVYIFIKKQQQPELEKHLFSFKIFEQPDHSEKQKKIALLELAKQIETKKAL